MNESLTIWYRPLTGNIAAPASDKWAERYEKQGYMKLEFADLTELRVFCDEHHTWHHSLGERKWPERPKEYYDQHNEARASYNKRMAAFFDNLSFDAVLEMME